MVSRVTLSQTFTNDKASTVLEALYRFPLYENSAVCAFKMEIQPSGRKIVGIVEAEEKAIKIYELAKAEGKTAGLVLQKEPDIFQTKVGNVPSNSTVTVVITYVTPLKQDAQSNAVRFIFPTTISPRYGSQTNSGTTNVSTGQTGFAFELEAKMPGQITTVSSPSHPVAMSLSGSNAAGVTLSSTSPHLDKDIVILISANDLDIPRCMIETWPKSSTKCAMLTLVPRFNLPRAQTEIIFIIDRSGSMRHKITTLKKALQLFLKSLPASPEVYFNICSFGSRYDFLFKNGKSQRYDSNTLDMAEKYVGGVAADYGGTEILAPLLQCMKQRRTDCQTSIILLTDGQVSNTESIVSAIAEERAKHKERQLRVFSLGIGNAVSHHLVEGIARAGHGYSQLVMDHERLDKKVIRMLSAGLQAPVEDLRLDWPGKPQVEDMVYRLTKMDVSQDDDFEVVEKERKQSTSFFDKEADPDYIRIGPPPDPPKTVLKAPDIQQTPESMPPLYNASRHVMYILFPSSHFTPQNVTLQGKSPDGTVMSLDVPISESFSLSQDESLPPILHTLAARSILGELQEGRVVAQQNNSDNTSLGDAVKQEGIRIGVTYHLASRWTGFVAVDEEKYEQYSLDGMKVDESPVTLQSYPGPGSGMSQSRLIGGGGPLQSSKGWGAVRYSRVSMDLSPMVPPQQQVSPMDPQTTSFFGAAPLGFGASKQRQQQSRAAPLPSKKLGATSLFPSLGAGPPSSQTKHTSSLFTLFRSTSAGKPGGSAFSSNHDEEKAQSFKPERILTLTDEDKVHEIIMQQSSNGMFPLNANLAILVGLSNSTIHEKLPQGLLKESEDQENVWMTVLVCVFLDQKLGSETEVWELIVEKAWTYVGCIVGAEKVKELKKSAEAVIG